MCAESEKYCVALVTHPDEVEAKNLAQDLIRQRLAACVNLVPRVTSVYEWKQEMTQHDDVIMIIRTRTSAVDKLTQYIIANHPDDLCGIISLPIQNGNPAYLKWIGEIVPDK